MNELRDWMLIMLFLHREAIPTHKGGNAQFYSYCMEDIEESRSASNVYQLYASNVKRFASNLAAKVRTAIAADDPPLIIELSREGKRRLSPVRFQLTPTGEEKAKELIAEISEEGQASIRNAIITRLFDHLNRCDN